MKSHRYAARAALVLAFSLSVVGCKKDAPLPSASATIGAAGGSLVGPAGTTITVPPGAVTTPGTITVAQIPRSTPPPGTAMVAEPVRLGPEGKSFERPVEVAITVPPSGLPPGSTLANVVVLRAPQGTQNYVPLPTSVQGSAVVAVTEHFSDFIAVVAAGDAGNPFGACGNTVCDVGAPASETCDTCPADCGLCFVDTVDVCFDGVCNGSETFETCAFDCSSEPSLCATDNGGCDVNASCGQDGTFVFCSCPIDSIDENGDGTLCTFGGYCETGICGTGTCTDYGTNHYCTCGAGFKGMRCDVPVTCGNSAIDGAETCDDGNIDAGDGCDSSCMIEFGWRCLLPGTSCSPFCGDGNIVGWEACDDGNFASLDGCDSSCLLEPGYTCPMPGMQCFMSTCNPSTDPDTMTATFVLTNFSLSSSGFDLDKRDDSAGASVEGCGVVDVAGGIDNGYVNAAVALLGSFDLAGDTQAFFAAQNEVRIDIDHFNGSTNDPCIGLTITFDSATTGTSSASGSGSISADYVTATLSTPLVLNPTWTPVSLDLCNGAVCNPASISLSMLNGTLGFLMDPTHTQIPQGLLGGILFDSDATTGYETFNASGLGSAIAAYGVSANLLQTSIDSMTATFASSSDVYMNLDTTLGVCTGPDPFMTNPNAVSFAFDFNSN